MPSFLDRITRGDSGKESPYNSPEKRESPVPGEQDTELGKKEKRLKELKDSAGRKHDRLYPPKAQEAETKKSSACCFPFNLFCRPAKNTKAVPEEEQAFLPKHLLDRRK